MPTDDSHIIYKVCPAAEWHDAVAAGTYRGSAVDLRDGFIHFSTGAQLAETLRRHFRGQLDLVLVAVAPGDLGNRLRWEPSRGGDLSTGNCPSPSRVTCPRSRSTVKAKLGHR